MTLVHLATVYKMYFVHVSFLIFKCDHWPCSGEYLLFSVVVKQATRGAVVLQYAAYFYMQRTANSIVLLIHVQ